MEFGWIATDSKQIAVCIDSPLSAQCVGAVVIAPPVGRDLVVAFRTLRRMAVSCAEHDFLSISIQYATDGDSYIDEGVRKQDPAFTADLDAAITFARNLLPEGPIHVVGLGIGGTFCHLTQVMPGEVRLAWEPETPSAFLRREKRIRRLTLSTPMRPGIVELCGYELSQDAAQVLSQVHSPSPDAQRTTRIESDRDVAYRILRVSPHFAEIPFSAVDEIVSGLPRGPQRPLPNLQLRTEITLGGGPTAYRELALTVGPNHLPAVLALPAGPIERIVIFTAAGSELRAGPGNLWVEASRALATRGVASIRVDRRGCGYATEVTQLGEARPYRQTNVTDLQDIATWARAAYPDAECAMVGACSGAWGALMAARVTKIDTVLAINTLEWRTDYSAFTDEYYQRIYRSSENAPWEVPEANEDTLQLVDIQQPFARLLKKTRHAMAVRLPRLRQYYRKRTRKLQRADLLKDLDGTPRIAMIFGEREHIDYQAVEGPAAIASLKRSGVDVTVTVYPDLDHSLLATQSRQLILNAIISNFADR